MCPKLPGPQSALVLHCLRNIITTATVLYFAELSFLYLVPMVTIHGFQPIPFKGYVEGFGDLV